MKSLLGVLIFLVGTLQPIDALYFKEKLIASQVKKSSNYEEIKKAQKELEEFPIDICVFVDYTIDNLKSAFDTFFNFYARLEHTTNLKWAFNEGEVQMSQKSDFLLSISLLGYVSDVKETITVNRTITVRVVKVDYNLKPKIARMLKDCHQYLNQYVLKGASLANMAFNLRVRLNTIMKVEKSLINIKYFFLDHDGENDQGKLINEQFYYRVKLEFTNLISGEFLLHSEIKVKVKNVPEVTRYLARFKDIEPDFYGNVEQVKARILAVLKNPLPSYIKVEFKFGDFSAVKNTKINKIYDLWSQLTLTNEKDKSTDSTNLAIKMYGLQQVLWFIELEANNNNTIKIPYYPNKALILKSLEEMALRLWMWKSKLKYLKLEHEIDFANLRKVSQQDSYINYVINFKTKIVHIKSNDIIASANYVLNISQFVTKLSI